MKLNHSDTHILLSDEGLEAAESVTAIDEFGELQEGFIAAERALTVYLNKREVVTLMTLGTHPELLVLGWLYNQRLIQDIQQVTAVQVDWETGSAAVITHENIGELDDKLAKKTVTTGCGQGTVFGDLMKEIKQLQLSPITLKQSGIYSLLSALQTYNGVYRRAGAVHGCALCQDANVTLFAEDVGRHNAVDAIAGYMWLHETSGTDKIFYTTGRLTSEMVMKVAQMGISVLLSRSGITQMGLDIAKQIGVTLIARAKGKHFLIYNGQQHIEFDAVPQSLPKSDKRNNKH